MGAVWSRLRWVIAYWLFRLVIFAGRLLPTRLCYAVASPIADICYWGFAGQRRNLVANLTRVLGDEAAAAAAGKRTFRHFSKYVIDFFQLPALGQEELRRRTVFDGWDRIDAAVAEGRGIVLVTLHLGQWEAGAAAVAAHGYPVNVIAETFDYEPMDRLVQGLRRSFGMRAIAPEKAALPVLRALRRGEFLCMLIDVASPGEETTVEFFGRPARMSTAPARIALRSGARVLPAVGSRSSRDPRLLIPVVDTDLRFEATGNEDLDVQGLTQAIAASLEAQVRRYPDQWFAFHPVWSEAPAEASKGGRAGKWNERAVKAALRLSWLPRGAAYTLAKAAGRLAFYLRPRVRQDVEDNLRHVLGSDADPRLLRGLALRVFENVALYFADVIRLPRIDPGRLMESEITIRGFDHLQAAQAAGKGCVVVTAHFGNPEMAVQISNRLGVDLFVLSEPLEPPSFSELMHDLRASHGVRYEQVGYRAMSNAIRHLQAGGCVAITCDRDIQGSGVPLRFFGEQTLLPLGAVDLAARTGAALVPGYCRRRGSAFELVFEEPLPLMRTDNPRDDSRRNAEALLGRVEKWLRADPGQWMVLERIWKPGRGRKQPSGSNKADARMAPKED